MTRRILAVCFGCLFGSPWAVADKVVLKNGDVVEGTILRTNTSEVVIEVNFSPTIIEERRIPQANVERIERQSEDERAYLELKEIVIPQTALDPEEYQRIITHRLRPFLEEYGYSSRTRDVRAMIAQLEADIARFDQGQIKLEGRWIDRSAIAQDDYQLSAREALARMRRDSRSGEVVEALNLFDRIEKQWPHSSAYPDAVRLALGDLSRLDRLMSHELRNYKIREEERERRLQLESADNKRRIEAAREEEIRRADAAVERSDERGEKYPPYFKNAPETLHGLQKIVRAERARLSEIDLKSMDQAIEQTRLATRQLDEKEFPTAEAALARAEELWPEYEPLPKLKEELESERRRIEEASKAQAEAIREAAEQAEREKQAETND